MVENGEIAAVLIDDEATLKRFYITDDIIQLIAENPTIPPRIYNKGDVFEAGEYRFYPNSIDSFEKRQMVEGEVPVIWDIYMFLTIYIII